MQNHVSHSDSGLAHVDNVLLSLGPPEVLVWDYYYGDSVGASCAPADRAMTDVNAGGASLEFELNRSAVAVAADHGIALWWRSAERACLCCLTFELSRERRQAA